MDKTVIVTGASGYIGGQTLIALCEQGRKCHAIDTRDLPDHLRAYAHEFTQGNIGDVELLGRILNADIDAIVHCAGTSLVGPSITHPSLYYQNNFVATKYLLDMLVSLRLQSIRVIFSSSAAVYGEPVMTPCREEDPPLPVSPYGESKLMIEMMLTSYARAYGIDSVSFRYFNACGADHQARHGQEPGATHIIARLLESLRDGTEFRLNGTDFATADGTCVRDYIHVEDLAKAHVMAIDRSVKPGIYNLSTETAHSNQQIIDEAAKITGRRPDIVVGPRREGDPTELTASSQKFQHATEWRPQYQLSDMITHAWQWYQR